MFSSPFQQPSRRQNALALQIQEARTIGDEALLSRLISQWVHRFGMDGAAELGLSSVEPTSSDQVFSPTAADASDGPAVEPLPMAVVEEEPSFAPTMLQEEEVLVEEQESWVNEETMAEDKVLAEGTALQQSLAAGPVPAPPISTPRSLRRWLPRREDDAFPKAS